MKFLTLIGLIVFLTMGCTSKVTQENYAKLRIGMPYSEVVLILGNADTCDAVLGAKHCIWKDGKKLISVQFIAENVILFSGKDL